MKPVAELRQLALLCIPTVFDLIATVLMNIGLLSVTASVYQMMRGAEMLFAALFTLLFLGRQLNRLHLLGILCCAVRAGSRSVALLAWNAAQVAACHRCVLQQLKQHTHGWPSAGSTSSAALS